MKRCFIMLDGQVQKKLHTLIQRIWKINIQLKSKHFLLGPMNKQFKKTMKVYFSSWLLQQDAQRWGKNDYRGMVHAIDRSSEMDN